MLGACSSKPKAGSASLGISVTDDNKSYLAKYEKQLEGFIKDQNKVLDLFNDALDGLYTQKYSRDQFASILANAIPQSSNLVQDVENLDVSPDIFDAQQNLIQLVNSSHQLLLDAIDMANNKNTDIDKETLRTQYVNIKTQQAKTANDWKVLRQQLETQNGSKNGVQSGLQAGGH